MIRAADTVSRTFYNFANWKWLVFFAVCLFFTNRLVSDRMELLKKVAGAEVKILDLCTTGWNLDEAYSLFKQLGEEGRQIYKGFYSHGYDTIYPLSMTMFMATALSMLFPRDTPAPFSRANLVHVFTFVLDGVESICIFSLLNLYPHSNIFVKFIALIGSLATVLKWISAFLSLVLIPIGLIMRFSIAQKEDIQHRPIQHKPAGAPTTIPITTEKEKATKQK